MKKWGHLLLAAVFVAGFASRANADAFLFGFSGASNGELDVTTSDGLFVLSTNFNQGWWSDNAVNGNGNNNYIVGSFGDHWNNFFAFDLSSVTGTVLSADLQLKREFGSGTAGFGPIIDVLYTLFDVSTSAADLLNKDASPNATIWADLGSGTSYGSFVETTGGAPTDVVSYGLNAAGLAALQGALGSEFFAIGGTLSEAPVPEPATLALFTLGGAGLIGRGWRRRTLRG